MTVFALRMVKDSPANVLQVLMAHVVKSKVYLFIYSFIYCRLGNMFRGVGATGAATRVAQIVWGQHEDKRLPILQELLFKTRRTIEMNLHEFKATDSNTIKTRHAAQDGYTL